MARNNNDQKENECALRMAINGKNERHLHATRLKRFTEDVKLKRTKGTELNKVQKSNTWCY